MTIIDLQAPSEWKNNSCIAIAGSKSETIRALLINYLAGSKCTLINQSNAADALLMKDNLSQIDLNSKVSNTPCCINAENSGAVGRFLLALLCITEGDWVLTGNNDLRSRPFADLVDALKSIGASINYLEKSGYLPVSIKGTKLSTNYIKVKGNLSSQFVSAVLLIAPVLSHDIAIEIEGDISSMSYIKLTLEVMKKFGINYSIDRKMIYLQGKYLQLHSYDIESDWSSASYWYQLVAISNLSSVQLSIFSKNSKQGDSILPKLFENFGVRTDFVGNSIILSKYGDYVKDFRFDCSNNIDLAMTLAVTTAALGIKAELTGIKNLIYKESNRMVSITDNLSLLGCIVELPDASTMIISPPQKLIHPKKALKTFNDHRIAMSFSLLAGIFGEISIENPDVVNKSYPDFWNDLKMIGVETII